MVQEVCEALFLMLLVRQNLLKFWICEWINILPFCNKTFIHESAVNDFIAFLNSRRNNQELSAIPTSISKLQTLKILDLDKNNFNGIIPTELGDLSSLIFLTLGYNDFDYQPFPESLENLDMSEYMLLIIT